MKSRIRMFLLTTLVFLLLSGCVVLDVNTLDTAVPLPAGKVKFGVHAGNGPVLNTYIVPDDADSEANAKSWFLSGINAGVGLDGENELGMRLWVYGDNGAGIRLGIKHILSTKESSYSALVPAFNIAWDDDENKHSKIESYGTELQWLYTQVLSENLAMTAALRGNVSYLIGGFDTNPNAYDPPYIIWEGGVRFNFEASGSPTIPFFVIPEIGLEVVKIVNGDFVPRLILGIMVGFRP